MKKQILLLVVFVCTTLSLAAQSIYSAPKLDYEDSWSVIVVPDTQGYAKNAYSQPICDMIMAWIASQADNLNIKMVLHTGDLVENDDRITCNGYSGDQTSTQQWSFIADSFRKLDGVVPYLAATGNHDYTYVEADGAKRSRYKEFFYTEKNPLNRKMMCQYMTNAQGEATLENAAFEMTAPDGKRYLFMQLEYGPRDTVLNWARRIADMEEYKYHRIVLLTHAYLHHNSERLQTAVDMSAFSPVIVKGRAERTRPQLKDANNGEEIFNKLVYPASNIELVVCGHIAGHGFRTDKNKVGRNVNQMLFDAQAIGGDNGGDGWIRILEFYPDGKTVKVKTFSPLFAVSPATQGMAWKHDSENEFTFNFSAD